jgi:predicted secreted Zn-dependent protease
MRLSLAFLSALIAAAVPAASQAADPTAWVGKYPFDEIGGATFWVALGDRLDSTVGPALAQTIRAGWGPQAPVKFRDGWTIAWVCKAHDCGDNNVTVAINAHGRMVACIERRGEKPPIRWQELGYRVVPQDESCKGDPIAFVDDMRRAGILQR